MDDRRILALLQSMTTTEKAALCSGADYWTTKPNPTRGIPALRMADGPHGLRVEDRKNEKANGGHSLPATCFPTASALACSFSPALLQRVGSAIATEAKLHGVGLLLGPGVNIKRSPLGGRNFEYYSEDPLLAGLLAAGFIKGVQAEGVAASLKHFAVNNQEHKRMTINAAVDDRALFDLYLKPFEYALQKAAPATVMCSYNRVNGTYASENKRLLTDILRLRFGFGGAVISDWGAVNNRVAALAAGLDLEMPASHGATDYNIQTAIEDGQLSPDVLDTACWNLLRLILHYARQLAPAQPPRKMYAHNHALAVEAAVQSTVLLKNEDMLPLGQNAKVAVIGEMAQVPRFQGGGSSVINPKHLVGFTAALQQAGLPHSYSAGYEGADTTPTLLQKAAKTAGRASCVLLFLGLPDAYECEGYDRAHLNLPSAHLRLLDTVCKANSNVCVVLCCGSPVVTPWLPQVKALLCPHLAGEGVGEALVKLVYGRANPSGKLAETWPLALEDTPCYHHFLMGPREVTYNESIFVGYRYYSTAGVPVQFPFGYGLSYTTFTYAGLKVISGGFHKNQDVSVQFTVANTGKVSGHEVAQVYLGRPGAVEAQPAQELVAFTRVHLQPGECKTLTLTVPYRAFGFYSLAAAHHVVESGSYSIFVGPSSAHLPLFVTCKLEGTGPVNPSALGAQGPYGKIKNNHFAKPAFALLYSGQFAGNVPVRPGHYTATTSLAEMNGTRWGRLVLKIVRFISRTNIRFSKDPVANRLAGDAMAEDLPFKNIVLQSEGFVSPAAASALLRLCNGQKGFFKFLWRLVKRPPYKRKTTNKSFEEDAP